VPRSGPELFAAVPVRPTSRAATEFEVYDVFSPSGSGGCLLHADLAHRRTAKLMKIKSMAAAERKHHETRRFGSVCGFDFRLDVEAYASQVRDGGEEAFVRIRGCISQKRAGGVSAVYGQLAPKAVQT